MTYNVLLVDDEPLILKSLQKIIRWDELDCKVSGSAWNGEEALRFIEAFKPDIVITDICMPKKNGIELLKELRTFPAKPEVILLSGHDEFEYAREGLQNQAFDYILKPIDHEELQDCIRRVIHKFADNKREEYKRNKHRIYESLTLGIGFETALDKQCLYSVLAIKLLKPLDQEDQLLKRWGDEHDGKGSQLQRFLYKFDKDRFTIVLAHPNGSCDNVNHYAEQAARELNTHLNNQCIIAIGKSVSGLASLAASYLQVNQYVESSPFLKMNIVTADQIQQEYKSRNNPDVLIAQAEAYLKEHFTEDIPIESVTEKIGLSVSHFSVLFKQKTGMTFLEFLTKLRVEHACLLLKTTDLKTYEIANLIGYTDQRYFSQVFKKRMKMTPSQFRQQAI